MSLCEKIAGTVNRDDFARFDDVFEDRNFRPLLHNNEAVWGCLNKLASKPILTGKELLKVAMGSTYTYRRCTDPSTRLRLSSQGLCCS